MPVIKRKKDKMFGLLHAHFEPVILWCQAQGTGGETLRDALLAYFKTTSGITDGTLEDHVRATVTGLGFTGTLQDQLNAFYVSKTGLDYPPDAARAFWNSFGLNFSAPGGGGGGAFNSVTFLGDSVQFMGDDLTSNQ